MKIPQVKRSYIKISGLLFLIVGAIMISLAFFLPRLIDINAYRNEIVTLLQQSLNRKVSFSRGDFTMHIGPSFTFDDVIVKEPDGSTDFVTARRITIHLALLPLLEKKLVLRDVILDGADIHLTRGSDGKLSIDDLLKPRQGAESYQVHLKKVQLKKGSFFWRDLAVRQEGFTAQGRNINFLVENVSRGHKGGFKVSAEILAENGAISHLTIAGTARLPGGVAPLSETELSAEGEIKQFEPGRFWPYYGRFIPFDNPGGRVDLATTFKGKLREFSAKGKLKLAGVSVVWPKVFHHPVNPRLAQLDYDLKLTKNRLDMPALQFSADGFKIKGSCRLEDITSSDLRIVAKGVTEPFRLEDLRQWIPYGIIADDASKYIEQHIMGGVYKLEDGSLDGRISQIVHMEKGTNYNVLHIKGTVDKGIVSYGAKVPAFANIKAGLEMLGKDFIISHASGTFGESPFKLEGKITDYPLDTPCQYPFQMDMTARPAEVAWLSRLAGARKLEISGPSTLALKGSGLIASYHLAGDWDLKQAAYNFPGFIRKPAGMSNRLVFNSILGPTDTRLSSLSFTLPPLSLSATAQLKYGAQPHLAFELQTNPFVLSESLPILSQWQVYHPYGKIQAHIKGSGDPNDFAAMDYSGTVSLGGFALQPGKSLKPVNNINGTITFKGNNLETSSINVRYGNSLLNAKGRVKNFKNPEAEIAISSPEFFLRDLAASARPETSIRRMHASVSVRDTTYTIRGFSGLLNSSNFSISGTYTAGTSPQADLTVVSSKLDVDDLLALTRAGTPAGGGGGGGAKADLKLKISADSGRYGKLQFNRLHATISRDSGVVYLQWLEAGLYGGKLLAKGRIAPSEAQGSRYDLNFNLDRIDAERFFQALDVSREVTGAFNLEGDITARGDSLAEIKKSALGNLRLRMEKGSLRKFSVLSKVFSILNFSQLLKFQLPDMVSGGMPYNTIKGSFSVRDGLLATEDLFIRSDAINISVLGTADMVREELNFTVGVQPLQTVDKIVNRIPVVGWLLTGKDKSFVTAYFEAKGKWANPQVKAIPVKSMAKGVQNVFRRMFELPVRLFTDTGEVILGK